jgi:hypothetical protein
MMPGPGHPLTDAERYHALLGQVVEQVKTALDESHSEELKASLLTLIFIRKHLEQHFPPAPKGGAS